MGGWEGWSARQQPSLPKALPSGQACPGLVPGPGAGDTGCSVRKPHEMEEISGIGRGNGEGLQVPL